MRAALVLSGAVLALVAGAASAAVPPCPALSPAQALASAGVVFEGVAQPGPAAGGILSTPARFKVTRYLKGTGPGIISVAGGPLTEGIGFLSLPSAGIRLHPGEVWIVYAKGNPIGVVETSSCYGTHLAGERKPSVPESSSPTPSPNASGSPGPVVPEVSVMGPSSSWAVWAGAGVAGLVLVMAAGWGVARTVVGTR